MNPVLQEATISTLIRAPRTLRRALPCAAVLALALPASALANATVSRSGNTVTVTSTVTEDNDIIAFDQGGMLVMQENSGSVAGLTPAGVCTRAENPPGTPLPKVVTCG